MGVTLWADFPLNPLLVQCSKNVKTYKDHVNSVVPDQEQSDLGIHCLPTA